ncbi:hypothetical protein KPL70_022773 [Citrus sinensis]|nr:hypothetical protein KPL70_022773 [Citrus sinensis]
MVNTHFWGCYQVIWSMVVVSFLLFHIHLSVSYRRGKKESKLCFVFPAEHKGTEAFRALVPPGKDPPPPLGGHTISMLIFCCSTMLTSSYPVRGVDGSVPRSLSSLMTAMQQQSVCIELPVLHLYS